MKINIRSKLILAISSLVVLLFSVMAYLFVQEKKEEMANDIYLNSLAFSKLTAESVVQIYDLYLKENSFVYFNRELQSMFEQNDDVDQIRIISYTGEILYDSKLDLDKKYEGKKRLIDFVEQIRSENVLVKSLDEKILYLKDSHYVDINEKSVEAFDSGTLIEYLVVPATERYSVVYNLNYHNLDQRVDQMINRIVYLTLFGVMLGMIMSFVMSGQVTRPIKKLVLGAGEIAKGNFKTHVDIRTQDEIKTLGDSFNKMADDLEKSMAAKLYQERVEHELKLATEIQTRLLPKKIPDCRGLDLEAGLIPAEEIGGDIYDFISIGEDKMLMYLGDVTGHGVPAGIVSSVANSLFYGFGEMGDLKQILVAVNRVLSAKTLSNMFMTLCLMVWDADSGKFNFASAGHEQILHYRAKTKDVILEPSGGVALGMIPDISAHIAIQEVDLQPGDYLVVYSDGIPEAWKNEKESYGMERFQVACKQFGDLDSALAIKEAILADVEQFTAGYDQMDDITLIVIKRTK